MERKDRPRPILAKGSRQLQTARPSRAATGGDTASNSDNGDGAASETRTASETPGSAIVTGVSCLAQLRGWLRGDWSGGNLDLLYSFSRDGSSAAVFHSKCDSRSTTLTIMETADACVIGRYTNTA